MALIPPLACEAKLDREVDHIAQIRLANPAFTIWGGHFNTIPMLAAGIVIFQPGVGEAWLRGSARMEEHRVVCARHIQRQFRKTVGECRLRRVQAIVETQDQPLPAPWWLDVKRPTETPALNFARWLGFRIEGLMRALGPNGENFYMLALVIE
jgi:hypothetical protein